MGPSAETPRDGPIRWAAWLLTHRMSPVVLFALVTTILYCAADRAGRPLTAGFAVGWGYVWTIVLLLWMTADARALGRTPCFDFGFLAGCLLPLSLIWYCLWSRGWRGLLMLLALLLLWAGPSVIAAIVARAL